jgi:hypothetical protein
VGVGPPVGQSAVEALDHASTPRGSPGWRACCGRLDGGRRTGRSRRRGSASRGGRVPSGAAVHPVTRSMRNQRPPSVCTTARHHLYRNNVPGHQGQARQPNRHTVVRSITQRCLPSLVLISMPLGAIRTTCSFACLRRRGPRRQFDRGGSLAREAGERRHRWCSRLPRTTDNGRHTRLGGTHAVGTTRSSTGARPPPADAPRTTASTARPEPTTRPAHQPSNPGQGGTFTGMARLLARMRR